MRKPVVYCTILFLCAVCIGCNRHAVPSNTDETIPVINNPLDFYREGYPTEFSKIEAALAERYSAPKADDFQQFLNYADAFLNKTEADWVEPDDAAWAMLADCRALLFVLDYSVETNTNRGKTTKSDAALDAAIDAAEKIDDPMQRAEVFLRIARTAEPVDALTRDGWGASRYQGQMGRMAQSLRMSNTAFWEKGDREAMHRLEFFLVRIEQSHYNVAHSSQYGFIQKMNPEDFSNDRTPYRFPDTKIDWLKRAIKTLVFRQLTHEEIEVRDMTEAIKIARSNGGSDYLKDWILPLGDLLAKKLRWRNLERLAGVLEPDERLYFLDHILHDQANPTDYQSRAIDLILETLTELPEDFVSRYLKESSPLGIDEDTEGFASKRELQIRAVRWRLRIGQPDVAWEDIEQVGRENIPEDVLVIFESPEKMIDYLEICRSLSREELAVLKRYPIICDALMVVNRSPRYLQYNEYDGPFHCGPLRNIAQALLGIGDEEAARVALRLMHKAFVDMPFQSFGSIFSLLQYDETGFSPDELFPQEFLDDLIVRCHDDFSDYIYRGHYEEGNDRFRKAISGVISSMSVHRGRRDNSQLEKALHFMTRLPDNKTCEEMRKELFFTLFREFPLETASALVDGLTDPEIKKEFSGYLEELKKFQQQQGVRNNLVGGYPQIIDPPSRTELHVAAEAATDVFQRCEALLTLAMDDLENGKIDQAVTQVREIARIYAEHEASSRTARGPAYRIGSMKGIEKFYSKLAKKLIQEGKYAQGIDDLLEGAEKLSEEFSYGWNEFLLSPLRELYEAVQEDSVRATVREKLQTSLVALNHYETTAQSQQLRAVLEMQIVLGFEEDAIPVLKTTTFVEKAKDSYQAPLWDGKTVTIFQLRCGLFDEAMKTYEKTTFRDSPPHTATSTTDRTGFLSALVNIAISRNEYDQAGQIVERVRQENLKPFMMISLAQAYQKSGNVEKALETVMTLEPPGARPGGYLSLLRDLSGDQINREQNMKQIETLRDKYCEEISKTDDPSKRYQQYNDIITFLYWDDQREAAMHVLEDVDSPYHEAWILLNLAAAHELEPNTSARTSRRCSDYDTEEQLVSGEYNSSNHYLNLASAIKAAEEFLNQHTEEKAAQRETPFEPDKVAMKVLLDKASTRIEQEPQPIHRANVLGAIGKMEFVYFSKDDAKKHFDAVLELLKSAKIEPNSAAAALQLPLFFMELGENEKALESIKIALFGNDPDEPAGEVDPNPTVVQQLRGNIYQLEPLARSGGAELAHKLFQQTYEFVDDYAKPQQLATLQITALFYDNQHPDNPILPQAKEQYRESFGKMIRAVNSKKEGYEKESALQHILFGWVNCEMRIQAVRNEIAKQAETESSGIMGRHFQLRNNPYYHSFRDFGNPFYQEPMFYQ